MSTSASKSKQCPPSGFAYLVPGRISINGNPQYATAPPAEEEIVVDAMFAQAVTIASYINPAVTLTLVEPISNSKFKMLRGVNSWRHRLTIKHKVNQALPTLK